MLEKDIEQYAVKEAKRRGILTWKLSSPARRGVPDRIFMADGVVYFREFKAPGNTPTPLQQHYLDLLTLEGFDADCIDSKAAVDRLFREVDRQRRVK